MFKQDNRGYSYVNVYHGDNEDCPSMQMPLDFLPTVGTIVDIWTERDERGNYYNEGGPIVGRRIQRNVVHGKVIRIEHHIEESGRDPREHQWRQHVDVFTDPWPLKPFESSL